MILTTTSQLENYEITEYIGLVSGETIIGANAFKDFFASIRDFFGGRSRSYEKVLRKAKNTALREMQDQAEQIGADAIVGIDLNYATVGQGMLMVVVTGTAVSCELGM